jgi:hypothetical protein
MSMAKAMGPFRDSQVPSCLSVLRIDLPAEQPLLIGHVYCTRDERDNRYSTEVVPAMRSWFTSRRKWININHISWYRITSVKTAETILCDKDCQWLATGQCFLRVHCAVSSNNKTDRHDIAEILLKVA